MKAKLFGLALVLALLLTLSSAIVISGSIASPAQTQARGAIIIDHTHTDLDQIPQHWIEQAQTQLNIYYGHTSHGSQLMSGLGVLGISAPPISEYSDDLGHNGDTSWVAPTQAYLDSHPETNVVMWSWCGGVHDNTEEGINTYLDAMNQLEQQYPDVTFVYMTGHLEGTGVEGNLHVRNNQIRAYCAANDKILFDFADIESYDPDGNYFLDRGADDDCDYDGGNWADEWCAAHPGECASCGCAHSRCLNCMLKGRAFWWMMARMAGWDGVGTPQKVPSAQTVTLGQTLTYTINIQNLAAPLSATVHLTDEVPPGLAYVPGSLSASSGDYSDVQAPLLRWSGVLTPTPAVTVTYAVTVTHDDSGTALFPYHITNTAHIAAPGYQALTRTATITVVRPANYPDLAPSYKAVSSPFADYGQRITYTVGIRNAAGPQNLTVLFSDTVQDGLVYVPGSFSATSGAADLSMPPTLGWSGVLSPTPAITITYAAIVTHVTDGTMTFILPQTIENTALIAVPGYQTVTRTATVRTNWQRLYLPLLLNR
jgi:uncharacterized repeat protein (TIGR01451 family)